MSVGSRHLLDQEAKGLLAELKERLPWGAELLCRRINAATKLLKNYLKCAETERRARAMLQPKGVVLGTTPQKLPKAGFTTKLTLQEGEECWHEEDGGRLDVDLTHTYGFHAGQTVRVTIEVIEQRVGVVRGKEGLICE